MNPEALGECARLSLTWGYGVPCWFGVGGSRPGGRPCLSPGSCAG